MIICEVPNDEYSYDYQGKLTLSDITRGSKLLNCSENIQKVFIVNKMFKGEEYLLNRVGYRQFKVIELLAKLNPVYFAKFDIPEHYRFPMIMTHKENVENENIVDINQCVLFFFAGRLECLRTKKDLITKRA